MKVALISGGMDSTTAAHYARDDIDLLMYLDTGTGLPENREYIEELATHMGLQLWTLRTHESYADLVERYGFPGPSKHSWFYRYLKERQLGTLATHTDGDLHLYTGVRSQESRNRMANVSPVQEADRWTWVAPIHDWSKEECREYIKRHGLPENPLWKSLGRSGDCYCGAYANRMELIDVEAINEEHAAWLRGIEDGLYRDDDRDTWAWHDSDKSAWAMDDDDQFTLCSSCNPPGDNNDP